MRRLYRRADAVLTDSTLLARRVSRAGRLARRTASVYPGVDARFAQIARRPRARPSRSPSGRSSGARTCCARSRRWRRSRGSAGRGRATDAVSGRSVRRASRARGSARASTCAATSPRRARRAVREATVALVPSTVRGLRLRLGRGALRRSAGDRGALARRWSKSRATTRVLLDPADGAGWVDALRALLADREREARAAAGRAAAVARLAGARPPPQSRPCIARSVSRPVIAAPRVRRCRRRARRSSAADTTSRLPAWCERSCDRSRARSSLARSCIS